MKGRLRREKEADCRGQPRQVDQPGASESLTRAGFLPRCRPDGFDETIPSPPGPGATAFEVIPNSANSNAQVRVQPTSALFAAAYAVRSRAPKIARLHTLTIRSPLVDLHAFYKVLGHLKRPRARSGPLLTGTLENQSYPGAVAGRCRHCLRCRRYGNLRISGPGILQFAQGSLNRN